MEYYKALFDKKKLKTGNVVIFYDDHSFLDKIVGFVDGPYHHCGIIYNEPHVGFPQIYEATYAGVVKKGFNPGFIPFDVIETGIVFTPEVKAFVDSQIGKRYGWLNFILVLVGLNINSLGWICSTYVGAILKKAGINISLKGLTPTELAERLSDMGLPMSRIDSEGVAPDIKPKS